MPPLCTTPSSSASVRPSFAAIWPPNLRTDATGRIILPGLEAGSHTATVEDAGEGATFTVREASNDGPSGQTQRITLRRAGP